MPQTAQQVIHDLSSMLTVSAGNRAVAEKHLEEAAKAYQAALERTQKALRCLADARIADDQSMALLRGKGQVATRSFDLNQAATEVGRLFEVETLELHPEPLNVAGDYVEFFRAVFNLCANARAAHGQIHLATQPLDGRYVLIVRDTGDGMPPEVVSQLWERGSSSDGKHGHGLKIVKRTITELNGLIAVKSERGKGTTFTIALPPL